MVGFIDDHRDVYGVESICAVVPIAPSTYSLHKARSADPTQRSARAQRDDALRPAIRRVWDAHYQVYGPPQGVAAAPARGRARRALHRP
jgi:putative transposase